MKYDVKIQNRLKRIDGQIQGVLRMIQDEKDCKDVVTQLSAIRSAVDRTIGVIVSDNLVVCMKESSSEEEQSKIVQEAINLVVKSR